MAAITQAVALRAELAMLRNSTSVECARRKVLAVQGRLDVLAANLEAALLQLEANRGTALQANVASSVDPGAMQAIFASGIDAVHAASALKRAGLETELVAADAALSEAIDTTAALEEVRDKSG